LQDFLVFLEEYKNPNWQRYHCRHTHNAKNTVEDVAPVIPFKLLQTDHHAEGNFQATLQGQS
jgi:hypothetical protein